MSEGAPDYGVGEPIVCIDDSPCRYSGRRTGLREGFAYTAAALAKDGNGKWCVFIRELPATSPYGFLAHRFRRLDPLPPEFFAGRVEEGVGA
jgi:hypothetical protein